MQVHGRIENVQFAAGEKSKTVASNSTRWNISSFGMGDSLATLAGLGIQPAAQLHSKMIYNFTLSCRQQQIFSLYLCLKHWVAKLMSHLWRQELQNHNRSRCWWMWMWVRVCLCRHAHDWQRVWQQEKREGLESMNVYKCMSTRTYIFFLVLFELPNLQP